MSFSALGLSEHASKWILRPPCSVFTNNFLGCEELAPKPVKYIAEDNKLECAGKGSGKCASRMTGFKDLKL